MNNTNGTDNTDKQTDTQTQQTPGKTKISLGLYCPSGINTKIPSAEEDKKSTVVPINNMESPLKTTEDSNVSKTIDIDDSDDSDDSSGSSSGSDNSSDSEYSGGDSGDDSDDSTASSETVKEAAGFNNSGDTHASVQGSDNTPKQNTRSILDLCSAMTVPKPEGLTFELDEISLPFNLIKLAPTYAPPELFIGTRVWPKDLVKYYDVQAEFTTNPNVFTSIIIGNNPMKVLIPEDLKNDFPVVNALDHWAPEQLAVYLWHVCVLKAKDVHPIKISLDTARALVASVCKNESMNCFCLQNSKEPFGPILSKQGRKQRRQDILDSMVLLICIRDPLIMSLDILKTFKHLEFSKANRVAILHAMFNLDPSNKEKPIITTHQSFLTKKKRAEYLDDLASELGCVALLKRTLRSLTNSIISLEKAYDFHCFRYTELSSH